MDAAASIKLMSHNLKGQTEITVSLIGDNMYLRDQVCVWFGITYAACSILP